MQTISGRSGTAQCVIEPGSEKRPLITVLDATRCVFPGCTAPIFHCDLHHIAPWQEGGTTQPSNLVAPCRVHHTLVEPVPGQRRDDGTLELHDQWQVRIDSRGLPEFIPPGALGPGRTPIRKEARHVAALLLDDTG
jgi:hypothetical protein